jgi:hypothetical protein
LAAAAEEVDRHVRIVTFVAPAIVSEWIIWRKWGPLQRRCCRYKLGAWRDMRQNFHFKKEVDLDQGCQMVYFQTQIPKLGKFWRVLQWKMLLYFMAIWSILRPFGMYI